MCICIIRRRKSVSVARTERQGRKRQMRIRQMKRIAALTLLLSFILFTAAADEALYPALSDPTDQWMQQLAVMSQRDEAFKGVKYNGGMLMQRG